MVSRVLQSFARAAALMAFVSVALPTPSEATRPVRRTNRPTAARGFNLFAGAVNVLMNVNRVQCNINNIGESCVDGTNSPSLGGGFWPKGSPNQYIFNSGLQIAAIIPGAKTATFPWPGDTIGAFFFDPRGDQAHGEGRTNVFNALSAEDIAAWPSTANVTDPTLFHPSLLGRQTLSQQDTWVRFWDGNTNLSNGRQHPMGLLVEQRGLAWNFPSGNQDIIYFLYRFINITSTDPAKYAGLTAFGYSPADITDIVAIAQEFQDRSEAAFNVQIPDSGFTWSNIFASFAQDPDVGNAGANYSTANLIFNIAMAYKSDYREPTWQYPSNINAAPFASAPGFEGVKYLKSPVNPTTGTEFGIAMTGNTTNGAPFPDAVGVQRLWRNLSGNLLPSDGTCSVPGAQARRFCYWAQTPTDTRFYESSGPFTLNPGETAVIVVAYIHAAPVAASPAATITTGGPNLPAFALAPFVGGNMIPGFAVEGGRLDNPSGLAANQDTIRNVERAAGWLSHADLDGDGIIEQCQRDAGIGTPPPGTSAGSIPCVTEVTTVQRSLLNKALVAQAVFDNLFLLPFAPEIPNFFLVPGDNSITVAWQPTSTETDGDPFFAIASNVASPLYDPNFRKFDVEGYRIWRGRTQSEMEVVAAFDYAGTVAVDVNGQFFNTDYGNQCAPELGIIVTCTVFPHGLTPPSTTPFFPRPSVLAGDVVQIPPGGRAELAPVPPATRGIVIVTVADTAVTGGASGLPALTDNGVPFAWVDNGVRNGFRYFYAVTAFDLNSVRSGPSSLESPLVTKTVTPRAGSGQEAAGILGAVELLDASGAVLTVGPEPALDATTAIFSGAAPPTNGLGLGFAAFVPQVLGSGSLALSIDSITPGSDLTGFRPTLYYMTAQGAGAPIKFVISHAADHAGGDPTWDDGLTTTSAAFPATPFVQSQAGRFGGDSTFSAYGSASVTTPGSWGLTMKGRGDANAHPTGPHNGPRFWVGAGNEDIPDPNGLDCFAQTGTFACTLANLTKHAGQIAGVGIFMPRSYHSVPSSAFTRDIEGVTATSFRAADMKIYWGAAGAIDSVVDVTHRIRVPFDTRARASWGVLNSASFAATTAATMPDTSRTRLTWTDMACVAPITPYLASCGGAAQTPAVLQNTAALSPMNLASAAAPNPAQSAAAATGNGFILYLNGHFTMFQMAALPAAGTVWNARFYAGHVTGLAGSYGFTSGVVRPPAVPGLRAQIQFSGSTLDPTTATATSMASIHTVPDPYYVTNQLEITANTKVLRFVNLPSQAIIRIYSSSGILVNVLSHNDATGGGEQNWNLRNRNNQFVASGVYFYHVEAPDGKTKVGRFTVVNYAQ